MILFQSRNSFMRKLSVLLIIIMVNILIFPYLSSEASAAEKPSLKRKYEYSYLGKSNSYELLNLKPGYLVKWYIPKKYAGYVSFSKTDSTRQTEYVQVKGTSAKVQVYTNEDAETLLGKSYSVIAFVYKANGKPAKTLSDSVCIAVDATAVTINNSPKDKTMAVGEAFDFNRTLTPASSVNKTFWTVTGADGKVLVDTKTDLVSDQVIMTAKGEFTPKEAGIYHIAASVYRSKAADKLRAKSDPITINVNQAPLPVTPTPYPTSVPVVVIPETISLTVDNYSEGQVYEVTTETVNLTGKIMTNTAVKETRVTYYSSSDETVKTIDMSGTNPFTISALPLAIGTNNITVKATATNGATASIHLSIQRISTRITLADNVIAFDPSTEQGLDEIRQTFLGLKDHWFDDKGTPSDTLDDEYILVLAEAAPLFRHITEGVYQEGDIIFIPKCEYFPAGLTLIYRSHDDAYPEAKTIDGSIYEMIHTQVPSLLDLIDEDVCMNTSDIDPQDPFAFMLFPAGTDLYLADEEGNHPQLAADSDASMLRLFSTNDLNPPDKVKGRGFQFQNLSTMLIPSVNFENINDRSILFDFEDVVFYDKDGNEDTENDRITISGEIGMKQIKPTFGLEWNPSLSDPLPKQFISKLSYTEVRNLKYELGGNVVSLESILDDYKKRVNGFKNESNFAGIKLEGVDMDSTIVLGALGINLAGPQVANIRTIQSGSLMVPLNPTLVILLCMDLKGEISTKVVFEFESTSYNVKGFNIQKDGFIGHYGSCAQNLGTTNFTVSNRNVNIYNICAKSKQEQNLKPVSSLSIEANGTATLSASIGGSIGIMIAGIIPAQLKGTIGPEATATLNGKLTLSSAADPVLEGQAFLNIKLLAKATADIRLLAKTFLGNPGFEYSSELGKLILLEYNMSSTGMSGKIYASDSDRNLTNNPVLAGAKVTLTRNDSTSVSNSHYFETLAAADGSYRILNIAPGEYTLEVSMNGYTTYRDEDYEIEAAANEKDFYLDPADHTSSLSGVITEADMDTISNNNVALPGITVTLTKIGSSSSSRTSVSDELGRYTFSNLSCGLYEITVSDSEHIAITSELSILTPGSSIFNITLEAISNSYSGNGTASGTVINSLTGQGIEEGLTLNVYKGYNITNGTFVTTTSTDQNGAYSLDLAAGNYTVYVLDERTDPVTRYHSGYFTIKVLGSYTINNQNGEVTPVLATGEMRIVLSWGQTPRDLDSHITGPTSTGSNFHVFYSDENYYENNELMCNLDVDDTSSYGPETVTIYKPLNGIYKYSIHDYTNRGSDSSMELANSGAYVRVYIEKAGSFIERTYYVPYNEGTVWNVFEYNSSTGVFTDLNTMEYISDPYDVASQTSSNNRMMRRAAIVPMKDYELEEQEDAVIPEDVTPDNAAPGDAIPDPTVPEGTTVVPEAPPQENPLIPTPAPEILPEEDAQAEEEIVRIDSELDASLSANR